jgi:hypothetical protein
MPSNRSRGKRARRRASRRHCVAAARAGRSRGRSTRTRSCGVRPPRSRHCAVPAPAPSRCAAMAISRQCDIPGPHIHTARLKVRVRCKTPVAEIEHDAVAAFALRSQLFPLRAHPQVRIPIDRDGDGGIGHRQHGLTEGGKARGKRGGETTSSINGVYCQSAGGAGCACAAVAPRLQRRSAATRRRTPRFTSACRVMGVLPSSRGIVRTRIGVRCRRRKAPVVDTIAVFASRRVACDG